jgi:hypothetical protein
MKKKIAFNLHLFLCLHQHSDGTSIKDDRSGHL